MSTFMEKGSQPCKRYNLMKQVAITQGQPYEGVSSVDGYKLDVRAGRHGSEEVAQDFNAGITADNALGLQDPGLPSELNFAVFGTMSMTIDGTTRFCPEMRIAQGHHAAANPWWIAGTQCHSWISGLRCPCGQSSVTFVPRGHWDYEFVVRSEE